MSEDSINTNEGSEEKPGNFYEHTYTTSLNDKVLNDLVSFANKGLGLDLTISIKGLVYTGILISGEEWCDIQIGLLNNTNNPQVGEVLQSYYERIKNDYYSKAALEKSQDNTAHYLHMKDALIWDGKHLSDTKMVWRLKVGEVDGFSLGKLSKS